MILRSLYFAGTVLWITGSVFAQNPTPWAVTPAGSAIATGQVSNAAGLEQYNPFNGYLNASLPLHHVSGRGDAGFDLVWNLQPGWLAAYNGGTSGLVAIDPYPSNNILGANNNAYGLGGPGAVYIRTGFTWNYCSPGYGVGTSLTSVIFVEPNGSQLTLTDTATNGAAEAVPFNSCGGGQPGSWDAGRGTSFRSLDGSQIQFNASSNVLEQNDTGHGYGVATVSGTLVFPNGLKYNVVNSNITLMEDRNGNAIWLNYGGPQTNIDWYLTVPALTQITDSLNRVTNINYSDGSCGGCLTITYPGTGGAARQVRVITGSLANNYRSDSGPMTVGALFPNSGQPTSYNYNPTVASAVQFPDGSQYAFQYNSYGEVAHVTLPTGGAIEYDYADGAGGSNGGYQNDGGVMIYRRLSQRREYANGGGGASGYTSLTTHTVGYPSGQTSDTVQVFDPSHNLLSQTAYTMQGSPLDALTLTGTSCNAWNEGLEAQTVFGSPAIVTINNTYAAQSGCTSNPQLTGRLTILNDTNLQSQSVYQYDSYGNIADEKDYDWGNGNPGGLLRETRMAYLWQANGSYAAASLNLVRLPWTQAVLNGAGTQIAYTLLNYDEYGYRALQDDPGIIGHDAAYNTGFSTRGNLTTIWRSQDGSNNLNIIGAQYTYDIAGNIVAQYDGDGHQTTLAYNDSAGAYALPIAVTNALGQTASAGYDYNIAKPVSTTDINGNQTQYAYNDALDRLTQVTLATQAQTSYSYPSTTEQDVYQDQASAGDQALRTRQLSDGLGRAVETDTFEGGSGYIATTQSYDAAGRIAQTTNPSQPGDGLNYATSYRYDTGNRVTQVQTADGAATTTSYSGLYTTVTDAAQKSRVTAQDGLGRTTAVWEDPGGFNYQTNYVYDANGNLVQVGQGAQNRSFTYDGLGRLTQAVNPESGTVSYSYDSVGNLLTRQDNRGITTTYSSYDGLNRVGNVSYSDGTPTVSFTYDAAGVTNGKGQLTSVANSVSTTAYSSFDALGDVLASSQVTAGQTYPFSYAYNLTGALTSETYPSGRVVSTTYDGANRPYAASGTYEGAQTNYLTQTAYWPQGAPYWQWYGNNVVPVWVYNDQLQATNVYATVGNSDNNWLFYETPYWGGSNDNGTLQNVWEYVGNNVPSNQLTSYDRSFSYDGVNRLTAVNDSGGYTRTFGYDQWGNMWVTGYSGVGLAGNTPTSNIYNSANNQMGGQNYDAAGNQTSANGNTAAYDAENRLLSVTELPAFGGGTESYQYDGTGQRVQKMADNGVATLYVYDALGQLAAEYATGENTSPCQTCYLAYDHLGSVRMVTDENANVIARHDYLPFGEEIVGAAGRNSQFGATDNVSQRFTGQTRDTETGLDYFNARYFGAALGRFTSPDPANAGAVLGNPQSWNAYSYVWNNPMANTDPTGLTVTCSTDANGNFSCYDDDPQPSGGGGGGSPPDLESICWWCWEYGYPYPGSGGSGGGGAPTYSITSTAKAPPPALLQTPTVKQVCFSGLASGLNSYLNGYRNPRNRNSSPMANTGSLLTALGGMLDIDPRLMAAIAGNESHFGTDNSTAVALNNPFGIGGTRPVSFPTVTSAEVSAAFILNNHVNLLQQTTVQALYAGKPGAYCTSAGCPGRGASAVTTFLQRFGGNASTLSFPCQ